MKYEYNFEYNNTRTLSEPKAQDEGLLTDDELVVVGLVLVNIVVELVLVIVVVVFIVGLEVFIWVSGSEQLLCSVVLTKTAFSIN